MIKYKNKKYKKPYVKRVSLITPEQITKQKELFNFSIYGKLTFICVISYRLTNVFFSFYCKSENFPSKVFLFVQYSVGLDGRDDIKKGKLPKVEQRGRRKNLIYFIRKKYNLLKVYLYTFYRVHPEMAVCNLNICWKIYKLDHIIQTLISQSFSFDFKHNEKKLTEDNSDIVEINPIKYGEVMNYFSFKFAHNGCRPRKARRLKKKRK